jgi:quinol-cytochrome oxidoreductase complex cytochrome b subunit
MMNALYESGLAKFKGNLISLKDSFLESFSRSGKLTSDKSRAAVMFNNFFLHIQGVKTHLNSLRPGYSLGLGLISFFLLMIAFASGIFLMVYYNPSTSNAFNTVKDINFVVTGGRFMRNIHKWAGEAMIIAAFLHMARVFFTGSYAKGRQFNWVVGMGLLVLTCILNLTGYMLPWDQLSYWAMVIVSNIMNSPKEITDILGITQYFDIGGFQKELFLGGLNPGQESLTRVYLLHILLLPSLIMGGLGIHFWRIRKDGGLTRPKNFKPQEKDASYVLPPKKKGGIFPTYKTYGLMELARGRTPAVDNDVENTVLSWPNLLIAELAVFTLTLAVILVYAYYVDAPLKELANATLPENPAKAPWYFLGFQELVSYSAFMGGIVLPTMGVVGLLLIPYLDREEANVGVWFSNKQGVWVTVQSAVLAAAGLIAVLAFSINFGWFRNWWPDIPQLLIVLINPGSIWVGFIMAWSLYTIKRTDSTRMGAMALFTMAMVTYIILTYTGTELRGPNWDFFWSKSQWPVH